MALPKTIVQERARDLVRGQVAFDVLLAAVFYLAGAPLPWLILPAVDLLLQIPYLRYLQRAPALLTMASLGLTAAMLAAAPTAIGPAGVGLWVLFALIPAANGYVLGRRSQLWQMALVTLTIAGLAAVIQFADAPALALDRLGVLLLLLGLAAAIGVTAWLVSHTLKPDSRSRDLLGSSVTVARDILVAPFNWVVGGIQAEALQGELHQIKRRHNPRWIVLDLGQAGDLGRHDLSAIGQAAAATTTNHCTVVMARPPVEAMTHLDVAQPLVGRVERYATVTQAVEAGLRRLGWNNPADKPPADDTIPFR